MSRSGHSKRNSLISRTVIPAGLALVAALLLVPLAGSAAAPTPDRVYFSQTGHYLSYGFLNYWLEHGQVKIFGYPITEEFQQNGLTVQYFERAVFEFHPDNSPGWQVELRRLGADASSSLQHDPPFQPVSAESDTNCTFYSETGHRLCFGFRDYWQQNGGLQIFGYPISEEFQENGFTVQYFERARFEYHPNNPPGWQVELGLLGDSAVQQDGVSTASVVPSSSVPGYDPSLWSTCAASQLQAGTGLSSGAAGTIKVTFTLRNTSMSTCTLYGYPGMLLLDAHGDAMPTTVHRGSGGFAFPNLDVAPQNVFLPPQEVASFDAFYHDIPSNGYTSCSTSSSVEITPPNDYDHLIIPGGLTACGGDIYVSPVVIGAQGTSP